MAETLEDDPNPMTGTPEDNCHQTHSDNNNNSTANFAGLASSEPIPNAVISEKSSALKNVQNEEECAKSGVGTEQTKERGGQEGRVETLRVSLQSNTYVNPETGFLHNIRVPHLQERMGGPSVICLPLHQVSPDTTVGVGPEVRTPSKDVNNNKRPAPDSQNGNYIRT